MTTYHYSPVRSEIVDFLMAPIFAYIEKEKIEWDLPSSAKAILGQAYQDVFQISENLEVLKPKIKEVYLVYRGHSIAYYAYRLVLQKGIEPQSIEETIEAIAHLTSDEMKLAIELALDYRDANKENQELTDYLEENVFDVEERWYWLKAYQNPERTRDNLVDVLTEVTKAYHPYYMKYAKTTQSYATALNLEKTLSSLGLSVAERETSLLDSSDVIDVYVLTPAHIRLSYVGNTDKDMTFHSVYFSMHIDEIINASNTIDLSNLATILKQLGDETRYKVLLAILGGDVKSKDIAEELGITAAAVSFHTQKLLNSQILLVNNEDNNLKYLPNKKLLLDVITKLKEDFKLEE